MVLDAADVVELTEMLEYIVERLDTVALVDARSGHPDDWWPSYDLDQLPRRPGAIHCRTPTMQSHNLTHRSIVRGGTAPIWPSDPSCLSPKTLGCGIV